MVFSKAVVKLRIPIIIITLILMIPAFIGYVNTKVNYDMLTYLPSDIETVIGQNELMEDFGKGAFAFLIFEGVPDKQISVLKKKVEAINHVDTVLWSDSLLGATIPKEILPEIIYDEFNTGDATLMAIFFDSGSSEEATLEAVNEIKETCGEQCFVSGISALLIELKELCEKEEPVYVALAIIFAIVAMLVLLDCWMIPFVFLLSMGAMILLNLGTNFFFDSISYITKALSAVLQLAVTMDYSIFLWHSYNEQLLSSKDKKEAMAKAIKETLTSVIGSSITTVAGFIALCFMSFTIGRDLGIVMAKGVVFGVIGCVTLLPSMILVLDRPLQKTRHRSLIPPMKKLSKGIVKLFPVFLIAFAFLIFPSLYGYRMTDKEVYYDMSESVPRDFDYVKATDKLKADFNIASTHMLLVDSGLSQKTVKEMTDKMEAVAGVKYVLGLESVLGSRIPKDFIPESVTSLLESDRWKLILINSEYLPASNEVFAQLDELEAIMKTYDSKGMLIGEAPCMYDLVIVTVRDFKIVTIISIALVFLIILFVEKSLTIPVILIAVIELGIFINLGLPHFLGQKLAFITPICISTIQLGSTVDYAILMTTRYKAERIGGCRKKRAVWIALYTSIPSIIVSGMGMFSATFGVALYSDIDIVSSMCNLVARGAVISMLLVIFMLPAMFMLFDRIICRTTVGMEHVLEHDKVVEDRKTVLRKQKKNKNADFSEEGEPETLIFGEKTGEPEALTNENEAQEPEVRFIEDDESSPKEEDDFYSDEDKEIVLEVSDNE